MKGRGKVYASICGSMYQDVPALHARYHEKDVVFVNLCLQSEAEAWRKLVTELPARGDNYCFDGDTSRRFMAAANLRGFPAYMLIGKDGRFVTRQAPPPSEPDRLLPLLDTILHP